MAGHVLYARAVGLVVVCMFYLLLCQYQGLWKNTKKLDKLIFYSIFFNVNISINMRDNRLIPSTIILDTIMEGTMSQISY